MNLLSNPRALRSGHVLGNPAARVQIAAAAALAGWHGGASAMAGGATAMADMAGSARCSGRSPITTSTTARSGATGYGFWGYGYPDIYAGIFAPYGYDDLAGYFPQRRYDRRRGRPLDISQMCGNDSRAVAGMPVDQIADAVQPTEAQRAALADLGSTSLTAAQAIRAACPAQAMLTAPGRLAAMQQRIEAMVTAVGDHPAEARRFLRPAER